MSHLADTLAATRDRFGPALEQVVEFRGETSLIVQRSAVIDVLRFLKDERAIGFLATLTAVDDWPGEPRFTVVYQLRSLAHGADLRVKVRLAGDDPVLPTCTPVYLNANWHERDTWDLFGIRFDGHPDLRRIMMPQDWEGHPLRKDYPLGYEEVQFTFNFDDVDRKKPYAKE
jgi:NADH-quinone oxidoreductase subunit C